MTTSSADRLAGVSSSLAIKAPCDYYTTANITLSGLAVQAGGSWVAPLTQDDSNPVRVLVKSQTNAIDNGLWNPGAGTWTRCKDFDGARDVVRGTVIHVYQFDGDLWFEVSTANPIVIGTSAINFVASTASSVLARLASTASAADGDALIGVKPTFTDAEATTQHQINQERVSFNRWLLPAEIADGLTYPPSIDVRAKLQKAITWCLAQQRVPMLIINGLHYIGSSANIDRPVDTTLTDFRIVAENSGAGFYTDQAINIFSSTIADTTVPVSEQVSFEGVIFEAASAATATYAVDGNKFLRMKFLNCYFRRMKCAVSTRFLQTYHFHMCQGREWTGWFLDSIGSYDISATKCIWEDGITSGGKGFRSHDAALVTGTVGCRLIDNLFEGCTGPFAKWTTAYGGTISSNYFEENVLENIDLSEGRTHGCSVQNNMFITSAAGVADANYYEVTIGECYGLFGGGNYCTSRLYDFTNAAAFANIGNGESASIALFRGAPAEVSTPFHVTSLSSAQNTRTVRGQSGGVGSSRVQSYNGTYTIEMWVADGGDGGLYVTAGGADLQLGVNTATKWRVKTSSGHFEPENDNTQNVGSAAKRCATIFAGTGAINTSDEREKLLRDGGIEEAVLRAWSRVEYAQFRFRDAVAAKGATARWHFGVVAQRVKDAFDAEGIDPFAYGILCYDEWPDEWREDEQTKAPKLVRAAGNRYGIRYEEALALECAYLRSKLQ